MMAGQNYNRNSRSGVSLLRVRQLDCLFGDATNMLHDEGPPVFHRSIAHMLAVLVACPTFVFGQAKPAPQLFVVCASQENQPTVYWSGVLQGPATALAS